MTYNPTKPLKGLILDSVRSTFTDKQKIIGSQIVTDKGDFYEVVHQDGMGTKGVLHWYARTFENGVYDAWSMNDNDILTINARPTGIVDHIMLPREDEDAIKRIIQQLTQLCREYEIPMIGGETSFHDNLDGMEISISMVGAVPKGEEIDYSVQEGDKIIAIESNVLNSNGYTQLCQELERAGMGLYDEFPWKKLVRDELTQPTPFYRKAIEESIRLYRDGISGMIHVAGGGLTRLGISPKLDFLVHHRDMPLLPVHPLFYWLNERGVSEKDIYQTFPVFGYIIFSRQDTAEQILDTVRKHKRAHIVGQVERGTGEVIIQSAFSNREVKI